MAIQVIRNAAHITGLRMPVVATIGNFDGVHRGHQYLLQHVTAAKARLAKEGQGSAAVISFYPHPSTVLGRAPKIPLITTLKQKARSFEALGVDLLYLIRFTPAFSKISPRDFVERILIDCLKVQHLVLGSDSRIGHGRAGSPEIIRELLAESGRTMEVVGALEEDGIISSRRVRSMIEAGQVAEAHALLGRPFTLAGRVIHGDARGRQIGFPTANLSIGRQVIPAIGIYVTRARFGGQSHDSVSSIGVRPTFGLRGLSIEAHVLDYTGGEFYGQELELEFLARLRDEKKFAGVPELCAQIELDIKEARQLLATGLASGR